MAGWFALKETSLHTRHDLAHWTPGKLQRGRPFRSQPTAKPKRYVNARSSTEACLCHRLLSAYRVYSRPCKARSVQALKASQKLTAAGENDPNDSASVRSDQILSAESRQQEDASASSGFQRFSCFALAAAS